MRKEQVRFGLYGCNQYRTKDLMDAANKLYHGHVAITACFDIDRGRADAMATEYKARACYDLSSFQKAEFDVAVISLPPFLHPDAFVSCVEAGKDVYLEKPVCVDDAGEAKLISAMQKYHPVCFVGISSPYIAPHRKALEIRRRKDSGNLVGFHHHRFHPSTGQVPEKPNWRHKMEESGGELNQHCCHDLHYLRLMCGEPESVMAMSFTSLNFHPSHEEEELTACFRLKQGMAVFGLSQRSHSAHVCGHVHLENKSIQYDWSSHSEVKVYGSRPRAADEIYEFDSTMGTPDEENFTFVQMRDFLTAYMGGLTMPVTMSDGIQAYRLARAIRESCRTRKEMAIPLPEIF